MKHIDLRRMTRSLGEIYNLRDDNAKGRLISLGSALLTALYNVFITGIFYTGFLTIYDISITEMGIISFIPLIASCFSVFSSMILERIQRRKPILLASKIFFYALYILATTAMPNFVTDPHQRVIWFGAILFIAHAVYALFSPGFTPWFYNFYPADDAPRIRYISLNQMFSSIMSSVVLLASGFLTDAVAGSPYQEQLIIGLRYAAFLFVLIDVGMQACAREYPYPVGEKLRFYQVFTLPLRYRKFMACMILMFAWNYISFLNNSLWTYHLLNHMHFTYTLINSMSVEYTVILMLTTPMWRKVLRRYSWIKTFGIANLIFVPTELLFFTMTPERSYLYVLLGTWQNILAVGLNYSYANVLYMNLPEENSTAHIAFYSVGCNLFAFLGLMTGTWVSSLTGDTPVYMLGMDVYSVQFTCLMRMVLLLVVAIVCMRYWRVFTPDKDIAAMEEAQAERRRARELKRGAAC